MRCTLRKNIAGRAMHRSSFKPFAEENGACRIELKVLSRNEAALRLYEKLSFKETKKYMTMDLA